MNNACHKDIYRQIAYNPRRFVAIFLIVALGVAFFSGVRSASPDMRQTVDRYFDKYNASDVQLLSTLGFDDDDVKALRETDGIKAVMPVYTVDGFLRKDDTPLLVSFQSLDLTALKNAPDSLLNRPVLTEGEFPAAANECLVDEGLKSVYDYRLGDTLTIQARNDPDIVDSLHVLEYKVVGFVRSVQYISLERGSSTKGSGNLNGFVLIPEQNFTMDVYTQVVLQAQDTGESRFSSAYDDAMEAFGDRIDAVGSVRNPKRLAALKSEAEEELAKGKRELADAESRLSDGEKDLLDGEQKLADGEEELAANREEYKTQMADALKQLNNAEKELSQAKATLEQKQKELDDGKAALAKGRKELAQSKAQLDEGAKALGALQTQIDQLSSQLAQLPAGSEQAQQLAAQLAGMKSAYTQKSAELEEGQRQYNEGKQRLDASEGELKKGEAALAQGLADYESGKAEYVKNLSTYEKAKIEGAQKLDNADKELAASKKELADARREYEQKKPDALSKIEDGRQKLADGEKQLNDLKELKWFVLTLDQNMGFAGYQQDADRVAAIGLVFPLIFFLVAALVSLTNMTRMVEDDRSAIGVLKALGYSRFAIAAKYLVYAGLAAAGGIALGVVVGAIVFPYVIFDAYGILYTLPPILTPISWTNAAQAGLGALFCAVVPALLVCLTELRSTPASLMRPRTPKEGRRILLERLSFVWKHLNFSQKVTCRNIFRYKKRLLMTVLGIAGCTALVFTGFGLKDSIRMMVPLQYDEIQKNEMVITLSDSGSSGSRSAFEDALESNKNVESYMTMLRKDLDVTSDGVTKSAALIVPADESKFKQFVTLRNRRGGQPIELSDKGVVVTEKLGRMLGLRVGDTIELKGSNNAAVRVPVTGLTENYVYHYIYMTPTLYRTLYGELPPTNTVYGQLADTSTEAESALSESLLQMAAVSAVSYNTAMRDNFDDMVDALDIVVLVLIVSAAALAFVVLFSLTNINIDERKRELATLKVLGFYDGETAMYLYRENIILTLLGVGVGLALGVFLLSFVITTAEVDMVMFSRRTHWSNYVLSSLITIGFAVFVNVIMNRIIKRIDMVESLKSVE